MLTDIDKEFDTPIEDENGELIEVIEEEDVFIEEDLGLEEQPDSFYEDIEDDIVQEGEEEEELDIIQEVTVEAKENYENAKEQLVAIFTSILEKGEITAEDNVEIEQVKEQYSEAYNSIKENTEVIQKKTLEERVQELADGMVGATSDEILNILTDDGRKPWLYKNEDNDVLVDMTAIPELTVLINKLFLIATDGENEGEFQLTPDFIKMIVGGTGSGNAIDKIINKYYLSTSKIELVGGTWGDVLPTPTEQEGKFLWIKTVTTFLDKDKLPQETTPICVSAQDGSNGKDGLNGADGVDGKDGVSLTYKGEFTSHPSNPQNGWYYRNTTEGKTFVYQDNNWYQMTVDGQDGLNGNNGKDGLSIEYKGELSSPPSNPVKNWTYKDSDNGVVYIYTGLAWEVMTYDGSNGADGTNGKDGQNGLSIFVTYNDSITQPATPIGNGTTNGWHTNVTSSIVWMSQKVASSAITGTWGAPIKIQGKDGVSVEEIRIQYSKNTSTTTAPADGWDTSMPSYQEGYFLWIRTRIKYSNNANYVYSTPACDQSWKANQEVYTQYKQLKEKFSWIVKSGTSESNMELTDALFKVLTETISLTAKNINLNGYINEGGNWSVDTLGDMNVKNLDVEGHLSTNELSISSIKCSTLPSMVLQDTVIKVTTTAIDDSAIFQDNAEYNTLQGAIDSIPTNLNGSLVTIQLEKDIREDILIRGISGGSLYINLSSNVTIYGNVMVRDNSGRIAFYGTKDTNGNAISNIIPNSMINIVNRECSVVVQTSQFVMFSNINIYGKVHATNNDYYYALLSLDGSNAYFGGGKITGSDNAFRTNSLGRIYISDSYGKVNNYVFRAVSGGIIHVGNDTQCNSSSNTKLLSDTACIIQISSSFNKWDTTSTTGSNTNTTTSTKSVTYKSVKGDYYRELYNNWKDNNTVRQGVYSVYGDNRGCWFFGTQFAGVKGRNITKVAIKITRLEGGTYAGVTHTLKAHGYSTKPSGQPSYLDWSQTFTLAVGSSTTVTITNSTILNAIKDGTCKGFGLYNNGGVYSVCSGSATVVITYQ